MSASFSMYVPFLRCESFPYISRRADWFPCALFPFHSPCTPLVFMSVPFMSLSVPLCFPFISLHFLAFPLCSPVFPAKKARCFQRFRKEDVQKHRVFSVIPGQAIVGKNGQTHLCLPCPFDHVLRRPAASVPLPSTRTGFSVNGNFP